ncbi:hypothetical protein D3C76_610900 [compost metagenome]
MQARSDDQSRLELFELRFVQPLPQLLLPGQVRQLLTDVDDHLGRAWLRLVVRKGLQELLQGFQVLRDALLHIATDAIKQ